MTCLVFNQVGGMLGWLCQLGARRQSFLINLFQQEQTWFKPCQHDAQFAAVDARSVEIGGVWMQYDCTATRPRMDPRFQQVVSEFTAPAEFSLVPLSKENESMFVLDLTLPSMRETLRCIGNLNYLQEDIDQ